MCVIFLSGTNILWAADNPFWIDAKIVGDIATVTIGIKEVELNAFGLVLTYDRDKLKLEEDAENGSYRYSDSFWDSYCTKGTALSNAKENRVLFSGINADMESSRFSGDVAIISFRIPEGTLQPGSTMINLSVKSLNVSDQLISLEESEKNIIYQLSWDGSGNQTTSEPEKKADVDNTTNRNNALVESSSAKPEENMNSDDSMDSIKPNERMQSNSNIENSDYAGSSDDTNKTDDSKVENISIDDNKENIEKSKQTDEENSKIKQKNDTIIKSNSLGVISLVTCIVIAAVILCCLGILIRVVILKKKKKND